jgi:uncharacterized protein YjlB
MHGREELDQNRYQGVAAMDEQRTNEAGGVTVEVLRAPVVEEFLLTEDGVFPNNRTLPLLVYRKALNPDVPDLAAQVRNLLAENQWGGTWLDDVYDFHHYHSTAHEVLAICGGQAQVCFGGAHGITLTLAAGDVVVIPAGVAHKKVSSDGNFLVVGAYPQGQDYDMCHGRREERPGTDRNIVSVLLPESDPLYGRDGPLLEHWKR